MDADSYRITTTELRPLFFHQRRYKELRQYLNGWVGYFRLVPIKSYSHGNSSKGPWLMSSSRAVHQALSVAYLAENYQASSRSGPSLLQCRRTHVARAGTAACHGPQRARTSVQDILISLTSVLGA